MTCSGCYDSFSGPWCDNCDQWPCICGTTACCVDADAGPDEQGDLLHTGGCANRCTAETPIPDEVMAENGLKVTRYSYPCGLTKGHEGDHWIHPTYRVSAGGSTKGGAPDGA